MKTGPIPLTTRQTIQTDAPYLTRWFLQPNVLQYFPMFDIREIEDAVRIWIATAIHFQSGLTALWDGVPCGMAYLNIQIFQKYAHQSLLSILVDEAYRGRGVGTALLEGLEKLGKEAFHLELLHLEVYEGNPAIRLYTRLGFKEFGCQKRFIKENGKYSGKIFMQKSLI